MDGWQETFSMVFDFPLKNTIRFDRMKKKRFQFYLFQFSNRIPVHGNIITVTEKHLFFSFKKRIAYTEMLLRASCIDGEIDEETEITVSFMSGKCCVYRIIQN